MTEIFFRWLDRYKKSLGFCRKGLAIKAYMSFIAKVALSELYYAESVQLSEAHSLPARQD